MTYYPYGLIGNGISAALVSNEGGIDWLCMPYFDSPSLCAKLLDEKKGGHFKITGVNTKNTSQEYVRYTAILKTRVETADGVFDIYDYMPRFVMDNRHYYCPAEVQRNIRVVSGKPKIKIEIDLKPNYATSDIDIKNESEYLKFRTKNGEYHSFYLYTNFDFDAVLEGREISLPENSYLVLTYHQKIRPMDMDRIYVEFERTKSYWLGWVQRTHLPASIRDMVIRSMLTLKLLMYHRTGAVLAAPTTSLPETVGKDRNWDYRYCWIRDGSMMIELFSRLGHNHSAYRYMQFILDQMLLKHENIAVVYGINGEKVLEEQVLKHLAGYENSRPVRIGNDAYQQIQNDLYGELIDAIYTYFVLNQNTNIHFDQELWTVMRSLVNHSSEVWEKPDNGIWEYRGSKQHHVFSKMMNWVAMDRAGRIAKMIGRQKYSEDCFQKSQKIRQEIMDKGWNNKVKAFTMHYGSKNADASVLLMLHYGFLSADDEKMKQTVEFCYKELVKNDYVMRYTHDDDFGKPESAFTICTFWMVNALYLTGRKDDARRLFDKAKTSAANPLGLFSEGVNPKTGRQTGNFPQGYSHMAFVQSALLLETEYRWEPIMPTTFSDDLTVG